MAWDTDLVDVLRVMVNDIAATAYTDDTLTRVLIVAGRQIGAELDFSHDFVADIAALTIVPDPTLAASLDDSYTNLITLRAACIMDQGAALLAAKQAIAVGDGSSKIDLRSRITGLLKLLEKGWCSYYEQAKLDYKTSSTTTAGAVVMTPFRLYAAGMVGERVNRTILNY